MTGVVLTSMPGNNVLSWTPTLFGSSTAGTPTYSVQSGSYVQIGKLIVAQFQITLSAIGGMTGNVRLGGLPVSAAAVSYLGVSGIMMNSGVTLSANYHFLTTLVVNSGTFSYLFQNGTGQPAIELPVSGITDTSSIIGSVAYLAA